MTTYSKFKLRQRSDGGDAVKAEPGFGGFEALVDVVDVDDARFAQPLFECLQPLLGVNRDTVFPGGAPAKHAGEVRACFGGELERFVEGVVADAGGKIDEGLLGHARRAAEMLLGFFL